VTTLSELGDAADWRCWICGDAVPEVAKPNDPKQPVADQIAPAAKGTKGRGDERLAHKGCNDLRKGRPPTIPWPERFRVVDAPELLQSLQRVDKRKPAAGEVVATCVDTESAAEAAQWVVGIAEVLYPGQWDTTCGPLGSMTAVRLIRGN
jgi:hypothetical protein